MTGGFAVRRGRMNSYRVLLVPKDAVIVYAYATYSFDGIEIAEILLLLHDEFVDDTKIAR